MRRCQVFAAAAAMPWLLQSNPEQVAVDGLPHERVTIWRRAQSGVSGLIDHAGALRVCRVGEGAEATSRHIGQRAGDEPLACVLRGGGCRAARGLCRSLETLGVLADVNDAIANAAEQGYDGSPHFTAAWVSASVSSLRARRRPKPQPKTRHRWCAGWAMFFVPSQDRDDGVNVGANPLRRSCAGHRPPNRTTTACNKSSPPP